MEYSKEEYLGSLDKIEKEYTAYCIANRCARFNTCNRSKEFEILTSLKGDKIREELSWILRKYDYNHEHESDWKEHFDYIRSVINEIEE